MSYIERLKQKKDQQTDEQFEHEVPPVVEKTTTTPTAPAAPTRKKHITPSMLTAWRTARPWILAHLQELQAAGWTRAKLFRAGRLKYPCGPWGVAFSSNWTKPGVQIEIEDEGEIRWTWKDTIGRTVSQAARPKH